MNKMDIEKEKEKEKETINPLETFTEDLHNENRNVRLSALQKTTKIAEILGSKKTLEELIPTLSESIDDSDEDEILSTFAEEIGKLVNFIEEKYVYVLVPLLKNFLTVEESIVREKSVDSISRIAEKLTDKEIETHLFTLVNELQSGEWFSPRISALQLMPLVYPKVPLEKKDTLIVALSDLVENETTMVRRAAAKSLSEIVRIADSEIVQEHLLPLVKIIANDDEDSVRLLSIDVCISLLKLFHSENEISQFILPILESLVEDRSWRVRYSLAEQICELEHNIEPQIVVKIIVPIFVKLISDNEGEVRTRTSYKIDEFCSYIHEFPDVIVNEIIPVCSEMINEKSTNTKAGFASSISSLSTILGQDLTMKYLLPLYLEMLSEEKYQVRLAVISKLKEITNVIGVESLAKEIFPSIIKLSDDPQWRIRKTIIEFIPNLPSENIGITLIDDKIADLYFNWLKDPVSIIRDVAAQNLFKLCGFLGSDWVEQKLLEKILSLISDSNYLIRETGLKTTSLLAPVFNKEILKQKIIPNILLAQKDSVPNVRFSLAQVLGEISAFLDTETLEQKIYPCFEELKKDKDEDVRFFAEKFSSKQN
ncbi:protein phosphatase 2 (formerly 2a) regulatory subunit a beta isoform-related [Anaeramoeba ignava]|uniref:Protein phosphatase 2 (Formerly 2a) regulatory subunit a beta isoform-related n=1 Tax=Anaeramoeba ignava TaxID=1746090 RepID=A0A9Q0LSR4_ANAIG|nr:protein phosphatase 2 (formerly 2a) regulatory subunit a beta isoform-related [Anaeramoeba ignava]